MSRPALKKTLLELLWVYLICFCLFFYSRPVEILFRWDWAKGLNNDFYIFQRAANNFARGRNIYVESRYFYPPSFAIFLSPVLRFPTALQLSIWAIGNFALVVLLWFLLVHYFSSGTKKYKDSAIALLVIASSVPLLHNFKWGQASLLVAILVLISYRAFKRSNHVLSALTLAIASSIKIIPAFFLLFYIANWKKGLLKLLLWFIVFSSLALLAFPLLSLGYRDTCNTYKAYFRMMTAQNKFISFSTWNNQTITGILFRYFSKDYAQIKSGASFPPFPHRPPRFLPLTPLFTAQTVQITGIIVALFILMCTVYLSRRKNRHPEMPEADEQEDMRFCLFVSGFLLSAFHAWLHYYVLLILPYYLLLIALIKKDSRGYKLPAALFALSFVTLHGNILIMRSNYFQALFDYLGLCYWANVFLFISLIQYLHRDHTLRRAQTANDPAAAFSGIQ